MAETRSEDRARDIEMKDPHMGPAGDAGPLAGIFPRSMVGHDAPRPRYTWFSRGTLPQRERSTTMLARMRNMVLLLVLVIGTLTVGLVRAAPVAAQDEGDTQAQIDSAMSAAPSTVS